MKNTDTATSRLLAAIFVQMLPATMVAPAIRPLIAMQHGGNESVMHAFMALNMAGAIVVALLVGRRLDRLGGPRRVFSALACADAVLLFLLVAPLSTPLILLLRTLEGGAHVGAATVLLTDAARRARAGGGGRAMGAAGAAIMAAVAIGHALGAPLVAVDPRLPFVAGAGLALAVSAASFAGHLPFTSEPKAPAQARSLVGLPLRRLSVPLSAAFVGRFSVGLTIVTFAVFAHDTHGLPDSTIGLLFALMTSAFAAFVYPAGRLADRVSGAAVFALGAVVYGLSLIALGQLPSTMLAAPMLAGGIGAALLFAPTLFYGARLAGPEGRGRAMSLVNAAGCLGMVLGPACAGLLSLGLRPALGSQDAHRAVLAVAGAVVLSWLVASGPWLVRQFDRELRRGGDEHTSCAKNASIRPAES